TARTAAAHLFCRGLIKGQHEGMLFPNPREAAGRGNLNVRTAAANKLGIQLYALNASAPTEMDQVFMTLQNWALKRLLSWRTRSLMATTINLSNCPHDIGLLAASLGATMF